MLLKNRKWSVTIWRVELLFHKWHQWLFWRKRLYTHFLVCPNSWSDFFFCVLCTNTFFSPTNLVIWSCLWLKIGTSGLSDDPSSPQFWCSHCWDLTRAWIPKQPWSCMLYECPRGLGAMSGLWVIFLSSRSARMTAGHWPCRWCWHQAGGHKNLACELW